MAAPTAPRRPAHHRYWRSSQGHTGITLAFFLDAATAELLAVEGGEPREELHVTLAYLGDHTDYSPEQLTALYEVIARVAPALTAVDGRIGGLGRFNAAEGAAEPIVALVDVPALMALRQSLVAVLTQAGFPVDQTHGFMPHVTLQYLDAGQEFGLSNLNAVPVRLDRLTLSIGDHRFEFQLPAPVAKENAMTIDEVVAALGASHAPAPPDPRQAVLEKYADFANRLRQRQLEPLSDQLYKVAEDAWITYLAVTDEGVRPLVWIDTAKNRLSVDPALAQALGPERLQAYGTDVAAWERALTGELVEKRRARYTILAKASDGTRRFTLGVAYPVERVDAHGDFMKAETIEQMCWELPMTPNSIGLEHADGTAGAGTPVEKYIYRGPDWEINGQVVRNGDFVLGAIWDEPAWELIQRGEITGWSIQGWGRRLA